MLNSAMNLDKKQIIIISVLIMGLSVFLFALNSLLGKINLTKEKLLTLEPELAAAQVMFQANSKLGQYLHLITREEVSLAIDEITKTGKAFNIKFIAIGPQKIEAIGGVDYQRLPGIHRTRHGFYSANGVRGFYYRGSEYCHGHGPWFCIHC